MYSSYNPYYNYMQPQIPKMDPRFMQSQQMQPSYGQTNMIQGKSVDSLEVVKAMDIPLDGSISYFPILDGSAIVTKQLQQDGTSKTIVYKPVEDEKVEQPRYVTIEEVNEAISNIDDKAVRDLKEEVRNLKRQIRDLTEDMKEKKED